MAMLLLFCVVFMTGLGVVGIHYSMYFSVRPVGAGGPWYPHGTLGDFRNILFISILLLTVPPYNFCNFDIKMV